MPLIRRVLALLLVVAVTAAAGAEPRFAGQVVAIVDGDTIDVLRDRRPVRVRLNGIDAPERGQAFGTRARQFVASLAMGQIVTVIGHGEDEYGRTIGDVILPDGLILNREVLRAGFAWWFHHFSADAGLGALEVEARSAKRGLWTDPNPIPPRAFRDSQATRPADVTDSPPPLAASPSPAASNPAAGPIIGNKRSRIYHRPDCPNYADVAPHNRVPFSSADEARRAGYRVARNCP